MPKICSYELFITNSHFSFGALFSELFASRLYKFTYAFRKGINQQVKLYALDLIRTFRQIALTLKSNYHNKTLIQTKPLHIIKISPSHCSKLRNVLQNLSVSYSCCSCRKCDNKIIYKGAYVKKLNQEAVCCPNLFLFYGSNCPSCGIFLLHFFEVEIIYKRCWNIIAILVIMTTVLLV